MEIERAKGSEKARSWGRKLIGFLQDVAQILKLCSGFEDLLN
jgi:hypothetical protein